MSVNLQPAMVGRDEVSYRVIDKKEKSNSPQTAAQDEGTIPKPL